MKEGTETDPLKARAVDLYRAKIAGWFSSRFRVTGSGLDKAEMEDCLIGNVRAQPLPPGRGTHPGPQLRVLQQPGTGLRVVRRIVF